MQQALNGRSGLKFSYVIEVRNDKSRTTNRAAALHIMTGGFAIRSSPQHGTLARISLSRLK